MSASGKGSNLRPTAYMAAALPLSYRRSVIFAGACAAIISGCATSPTASIPVAVSCVKEAPAKPETQPETAILAMPDYAATLTVWTERLELKSYAERAEAVINGCK